MSPDSTDALNQDLPAGPTNAELRAIEQQGDESIGEYGGGRFKTAIFPRIKTARGHDRDRGENACASCGLTTRSPITKACEACGGEVYTREILERAEEERRDHPSYYNGEPFDAGPITLGSKSFNRGQEPRAERKTTLDANRGPAPKTPGPEAI